jgi:hypothetical protein
MPGAVRELSAGEWEDMRDSYDRRLGPDAGRIAEIEARERGGPADREERAARITGDRVGGIRAALKGAGRGRTLADAAQRATGDARALGDLYRDQGESLATVMSEWSGEGAERKKLREALAATARNLERARGSLVQATETAEAMSASAARSGVLQKMGGVEAEASNAADRLKARWQRERAMRDREREQRERSAAERERGVR